MTPCDMSNHNMKVSTASLALALNGRWCQCLMDILQYQLGCIPPPLSSQIRPTLNCAYPPPPPPPKPPAPRDCCGERRETDPQSFASGLGFRGSCIRGFRALIYRCLGLKHSAGQAHSSLPSQLPEGGVPWYWSEGQTGTEASN